MTSLGNSKVKDAGRPIYKFYINFSWSPFSIGNKNSTSFLIEPWNFHKLFLQYQPWKFHPAAVIQSYPMLFWFPFVFIFWHAYSLVPNFTSLSASSLCAMPQWAGKYVAIMVTGSIESEMYFISSIMLWCRSCFVGEMIAFFAAVQSLNMWTLLKDHRVERDLIYFMPRSSVSTSPW